MNKYDMGYCPKVPSCHPLTVNLAPWVVSHLLVYCMWFGNSSSVLWKHEIYALSLTVNYNIGSAYADTGSPTVGSSRSWQSMEMEIQSLLEKLLDINDAMSRCAASATPTTSVAQKLARHRDILHEFTQVILLIHFILFADATHYAFTSLLFMFMMYSLGSRVSCLAVLSRNPGPNLNIFATRNLWHGTWNTSKDLHWLLNAF